MKEKGLKILWKMRFKAVGLSHGACKCALVWAWMSVWMCVTVCEHVSVCVFVWIYPIRWKEAPVCQPIKLASGTGACQRALKGFQYLGMISWTNVISHLSTEGLWGFREGLHLPGGHETFRLHVVVTDGAVGKCQMGSQRVSLSPCLLQKSLA